MDGYPWRAMIHRFRDAYVRFKLDCAHKLVMTLLVKNEADIILDNILFHLAVGVDFIIVTDNGSTDATLDILRELQAQGLIALIQEKEYIQERLVNHMGRLARDYHHATILFHADTDEFWTPVGATNLKQAFLRQKRELVFVHSKVVVPARETFREPFPQKSMYLVEKPLPAVDLEKASESVSLMVLEQYPKIMFSVKDRFREVAKGNHHMVGEGIGEPYGAYAQNIVIHHFPIKSYTRFMEKVKNGGEVYARNRHYAREQGWHWKRWYHWLNEGRFDSLVDQLIPPRLDELKGIQVRPFNYAEEIRAVRQKRRVGF